MVSKKNKKKIFFFFTFLNCENGKKVALSIGNGAEIRTLEMGRKSPAFIDLTYGYFS